MLSYLSSTAARDPPARGEQDLEGGSQKALRARDPDRGRMVKRAPLNGRLQLMQAAVKGGRGTPQPTVRAHGAQRGHGGNSPITPPREPTGQQGPGHGMPPPRPSSVRKPRKGRRGQGTDRARQRRAGQAQTKGRTPLYVSVHSHRMACSGRRSA